jgi:propionyl-CoA carboxylase alpha chain
MVRAIDEYEIIGLETTLGFCRYVMNHDAFRSGQFDTRFVEEHFRPSDLTVEKDDALLAAVLATMAKQGEIDEHFNNTPDPTSNSKWKKNRSKS